MDQCGHGERRALELRVRATAYAPARCDGVLKVGGRPGPNPVGPTVAAASVPWVLAQALGLRPVGRRAELCDPVRQARERRDRGYSGRRRGYHHHSVCGLSNGVCGRPQHVHNLPGHYYHRLAPGPRAHARPLDPFRGREPGEERRRGPVGHGCGARGHRGTRRIRDWRDRHARVVAAHATRHQPTVGGGAGRPRPVAPRLPHSLGTGDGLHVLRDRRGAGRAAPGDHALAASYQGQRGACPGSAIRGGCATAFFPSPSRRATGG